MFNFLFGTLFRGGWRGIKIFDGALGEAQEYAIEELVEIGIDEALGTMESMVGNPGQQAIYEKYIIDSFTQAAEEKLISDNGEFLTIGDIDMPYKEAVEIILQTGCDIVNEYYKMAQDKDVILEFL